MAWSEEQGLQLYPHQEEAAIELFSGNNVVLATPTGSGKSMVAIAAHFAAMAADEITYYTAPIKALVIGEVLRPVRDLRRRERRHAHRRRLGQLQAPIIACTAEVLANIALREGEDADIGQVVMDEFHFYADPQRGWAWQVPLLTLPQAQFLLMSATLGDVSNLREDLTRRTDATPPRRHRRAPRPAALHLEPRPLHEADRGSSSSRPGPGLRRPLHAGVSARTRPVPALRQALHERRARPDRRRHRRLPLHRRLRQDAQPARARTASASTTPACSPATADSSSNSPRPASSRSSPEPTRSASASTSRSAPSSSPASPSSTAPTTAS